MGVNEDTDEGKKIVDCDCDSPEGTTEEIYTDEAEGRQTAEVYAKMKALRT